MDGDNIDDIPALEESVLSAERDRAYWYREWLQSRDREKENAAREALERVMDRLDDARKALRAAQVRSVSER